ncbi:MAG: glutaredoxin family protein [Ignavibacteriales bacterium]|nr:glutaredoxin family protein [Ignavibacteriales bacterium]
MENITVYSTTWCGDCRRTKRFLNDRGISFEEIDIDQDPASAQRVIDWSGGRRVIPTIKIDCESKPAAVILHNPPLAALAEVLGL